MLSALHISDVQINNYEEDVIKNLTELLFKFLLFSIHKEFCLILVLNIL